MLLIVVFPANEVTVRQPCLSIRHQPCLKEDVKDNAFIIDKEKTPKALHCHGWRCYAAGNAN